MGTVKYDQLLAFKIDRDLKGAVWECARQAGCRPTDMLRQILVSGVRARGVEIAGTAPQAKASA